MAQTERLVRQDCLVSKVKRVTLVLMVWTALSALLAPLVGRVLRGVQERQVLQVNPERAPAVNPEYQARPARPEVPAHLAARANRAPQVIPEHLAARVRRAHQEQTALTVPLVQRVLPVPSAPRDSTWR